MIISYDTDVGRVRSENQDSVYVKQIDEKTALLIVADGMGGHNGGKTASTTAIDVISKNILAGYRKDLSCEETDDLLVSSIQIANQSVYEEAFKNAELKGMGTTAVVALVSGDMLHTANVGDSRLYVYSGKKLSQVTTDHSYVESLVLKGLISKDEAKTHPQKNVITRAIGADMDIEIDIFRNSIAENDVILMCTDGLHGLVSERDIKKVLKGDIEKAAESLVLMANEKGGKDNISVITVKIN